MSIFPKLLSNNKCNAFKYLPNCVFGPIINVSKTKEKAETLVYKKLTSLIESWI